MKKILEIGKPPLLIGLAAFLLLSLLLGFWQGERALAIISIFAIGLAGIGSELVLMLAFQVCYGYVFNLIGILISGFMAGLALGAYAFQKLQSKLQLWPIAGLTLTLVSEALVMILCVPVLRSLSHHPLGGPVTLGIVLVLLIATAFFSGICFPLSAYLFTRRSRAGTGLIAGWINAWDHFGGSLGAVLTSVILIPLFGLEFSLFFFALLILAGLGSALTLFRSR